MQSKHTIEWLQAKATEIRRDIITMLETAGSGHSAGPLGMADVFTALYFEILNHKPEDPDWVERDILVLSNGHIVPVRYAAMAESGYFNKDELNSLRKFGSRLQGHPERLKLPGLETSSGPLGSGLSQAVGMALGLRLDQYNGRTVYVIMSDGELDEGNTWEAVMMASKEKLGNLIAIVDRNNIQIDGPTETVMPLEDLRHKWEGFGWHVIEIDGNDIESVLDACSMAKAVTGQPVVILAHTIPGKGVSFMENDYHWHGQAPNQQQAEAALNQLRTLDGRIRSEHE